MKKRIFTSIMLGMAALALALPAYAHTGGFTYEATVGDYFVDIGASKLVLNPHELILFEYNLYSKNDPNNLANFDRVYVTIGDGTKVILSTFVYRPEGMLTTLSYDFPHAGKYEMSARFENGQGTMAEVSFPLDVQSKGVAADVIKSGSMFMIFGIAIGAGWMYLRKRVE
jgi:hypothetical protein